MIVTMRRVDHPRSNYTLIHSSNIHSFIHFTFCVWLLCQLLCVVVMILMMVVRMRMMVVMMDGSDYYGDGGEDDCDGGDDGW